jgi:hypothetical protein
MINGVRLIFHPSSSQYLPPLATHLSSGEQQKKGVDKSPVLSENINGDYRPMSRKNAPFGHGIP